MKTLIFLLALLIGLNFEVARAITPDELRKSIGDKTNELKEINNQIQETQGSLNDLSKQKQSLNKEVKGIDYNISQLNLGIRSSEINIQKAELELDLLDDGKKAAEDGIIAKKKAIAEVLRQIQQKDDEDIIQILFRNSTLADSFSEIQNLQNLQNGLSDSTAELADFYNQLTQTIDETDKTKKKLEKENSNLNNRKLILGDQKQEKATVLKLTKNQESVYQKQLSELKKQQEAIAAEIEKIEAELRIKIDPSLLPTSRPGVLAIPVGIKPVISQTYGNTIFAQRYNPAKWHNGLDFAGPLGTPILAAGKGIVLKVDNQDLYCPKGAYGKYIVIKHENNLTTLYGHLSLQIVKEGDHVEIGEVIGYMGKSGWSTGSHLHFTVWDSFTFNFKQSRICGLMPVGGDINPTLYLDLK